MVSQTSRKHSHQWTAFEHHALLCLIAKQVQITGVVKPGDSINYRQKKKYFDLAGSVKHAHHSVAEQLNSALSDASETGEIPHNEVSAMIDKLLSRKAIVKYMERQSVPRITRAMKRVWNRDLKFDTYGGRKGQMENLKKQKASRKATAVKKSVDGVDSSWGGCGQVDALMAGAQDTTDSWGEEVTVAAFMASEGRDPFIEGAFEPVGNNDIAVGEVQAGDEIEWGSGSSTLVAETSSADPWGDMAVSRVQEADDMEWGGGSSAFTVTTPSADPWAESASAFGCSNIASFDPWTANSSAFVNAVMTSSDLPAEDTSSFAGTTIDSSEPGCTVEIVSSQSEMTTLVSGEKNDADISMSEDLGSSLDHNLPSLATATTSPQSKHSPIIMAAKPKIIPDASTSINPERLAKLEADKEMGEEDDAVQEKAMVRGKGENFIPMPFNRLEMMKKL